MIGDRGSLVHKKWIYSNNKKLAKVKTKLNKWYDWLINHVPKPIKDGASKAFKTFKDKVMGLYNRVAGSAGNETRIKGPEPFKPIELEQAFGGAYRSYRVNGRPKIDVDTFFNRIRKELIGLIKRELKTRTSARIQTTAWIRFVRDDEEGQERVELAFNSLMTSVYRGSETDQIVDGMIAKGPLSIYGWYGTRNIAYGTRIFFNCLDTGQEVFLRAFHMGQPLFLPIFFINYYVEFEIY